MVNIDILWDIRQDVKVKKPLVYNITNNVVTNFTANILLAAGASPIMSEGLQEAGELAKAADVLVLNIGTLHSRQFDYFLKAGKSANEEQKPVVLDPVGVGATSYRNNAAAEIVKKVKLTLIRGNYGEISFLAGLAGHLKGVDSMENKINVELIRGFAKRAGVIVAATGDVDYLTDGKNMFANSTGHIFLQPITGSGCALTSLAGAFMTVTEDKCLGVLAALAFYGVAAEKAASFSRGPGSFAVNFLDALYCLEKAEFREILEGKLLKVV